MLFQGYKLNVGSLPFAYLTYVDFDPFAKDPSKILTNHGGLDIEILQTISEAGVVML